MQEDQRLQRLFETRNLHNAHVMWRLSLVHNRSSVKRELLTAEDGVFPFLHLLDMARSFEVTDPRDKIYGLLKFSTSKDSIDADSIVPDYTLSASAVYTQVTRAILEKQHNLDILALVLHTPTDSTKQSGPIKGLPSWIPNYFSGETAFPFSNMNVGHQYTASFSHPVTLLPVTDPRTLQLQGITMDVVQIVGPSLPHSNGHKMDSSGRMMLQWCVDAGISASTLAATLTAGRNQDGKLLRSKRGTGVSLASRPYFKIRDSFFRSPQRSPRAVVLVEIPSGKLRCGAFLRTDCHLSRSQARSDFGLEGWKSVTRL